MAARFMTKFYVIFIGTEKRAILDFTDTAVTVINHHKWTEDCVCPKDSKNNNRTLTCVNTNIDFCKNDSTFSFDHIILQKVQLPILIKEFQAVGGVGLSSRFTSDVQDTSNCVPKGAHT